MDLNLITNRWILNLSSYAKKIGLKYYSCFDSNDFAIKQISIENGIFPFTAMKQQFKYVKQQIIQFVSENKGNNDIAHLGYNIEVLKEKTLFNLLLSYKAPPPGEVETFIHCFKANLSSIGGIWNEDIVYRPENIFQLYMQTCSFYGITRTFLNPFNTKINDFNRTNILTESYDMRLISLLASKKEYKYFYIKNAIQPDGHHIITLLAEK